MIPNEQQQLLLQQPQLAKSANASRRFWRDQRGAGLVEYILLAALIAIACIGVFQTFQGKIGKTVTSQGDRIEADLSGKK